MECLQVRSKYTCTLTQRSRGILSGYVYRMFRFVFTLGSYPVILRAHSLLCTQGSLLAEFMNLVKPCAR